MISLIAAIGRNRGIGHDNQLPWNLPDDMKRFRELTRGHPVIMGRKTYESIGHVLPGRTNIVVTRDSQYAVPGGVTAGSIEEALKAAGSDKEVFVIGGGEIYKLALPYADRLYLTHVETDIPADAFFPEFNEAEWDVIETKGHAADDKHPYAFVFKTYEKKKE